MFKTRLRFNLRLAALSQGRQRTGRKFRRMVIEPMEGRLMLSTTGLEVAPLNLHAAQVTLDSEHPPAMVAGLNEGGFIKTLFSAGAPPDGDYTVSVLRKVDSIDFQSEARAATFTTKLAETWSLFGSSGTIRSVVIRAEYEGGLDAAVEPIADLTAPGMDQDEGGAIAIEFILASAGSGTWIQPPGNEKSALSSAKIGEGSNSIPGSTASMPRTNGSLAGEWARGVVFELAGGEPETGRPTMESEGTDADDPLKDRLGRPLSSTGAQAPGFRQTAVNLAVVNSEDRSASDGMRPFDDTEANRGVPGGHAEIASHDSTPGTARLDPPAAAPGPAADGVAESAVQAAFEQLDESKGMGIHSLADYSRRALEATPLLLLLALERVAARNSRRGSRDCSTTTASVPRRPSG